MALGILFVIFVTTLSIHLRPRPDPFRLKTKKKKMHIVSMPFLGRNRTDVKWAVLD